MRTVTRLLCQLLLPLALCCQIARAGEEGAAANDGPLVVRIGHVAPTSGPIAHLGQDNENGAILAVEELNRRGLRIGGRPVTFELVLKDDAADPRQGQKVARELVAAKVAGVVGHLNSGTSIPGAIIYAEAGLVQIAPAATNPKLTRLGFPGVFRMVAHDGALARGLAQFMASNLALKTVVIVDDGTVYGRGMADEFRFGADTLGLQVQERATLSADDAGLVAKIAQIKPDLVFFGGLDNKAGPLLRQMRQSGIGSVFLGGDGICTNALTKAVGNSGRAVGQVYCAEAGGVDAFSEKKMSEFTRRFAARFGKRVQIYAPMVYDAINIMADAMVRANSIDPARYQPALAATDYNGVTGPIQFDATGDIRGAALTVFTYEGQNRLLHSVVHVPNW
jgi:branched-chain amino acid transport system substrate-binding protein